MATLLVSSKGQIVLPAELRRRLALGTGSRLEVLEAEDGLKLRVVRSVPKANVAKLVGMIKAKKCGVPRRLQDFDAASLLAKPRSSKP